MKRIELLAPAKNFECAKAAVNCGADALYVGGPSFGARASAGNSIENIQQIIEYAHLFSVKVYIALNTILDDKEIIEAHHIITRLYEIGADAIIIQDMGLLELDLPPIPIHASTQCNNNSVEKINFLEKIGLKRVILPRELDLKQIKDIKDNTNIELEAFIHGALCVSYSGQCYMSYAIGGRSGNRGECAQPCRKKYTLMNKNGKVLSKSKHLLCLKDFNLSAQLEELIDVGICSFKIEGRLKDEAYVKNIVSLYRQKLDKIIEKKGLKRSSIGQSNISFTPNPYKTFNREYSTYFINGRQKGITSFDTPKSLGEKIGKVTQVKEDCFKIDTRLQLNNGDGICFFDETKELKGTVINNSQNGLIYPQRMDSIKPNTLIYRNNDHAFSKELEKNAIERKIGIDITFKQNESEIILKAICEDAIESEIVIKNNFELANNTEKANENCIKQLSKLGETPFEAKNINIKGGKSYFIPVKTLNELRRELIKNLTEARIKQYNREEVTFEKSTLPYFENELDYSANIFNKYAKAFYGRHGTKVLELAAESGIDMANKKIMTTKHCLRYEFDMCVKQNSNETSELYLLDEYNQRYDLKFDCKNCRMEVYFSPN